MDADLIETFLDLCETRSFNRSAERLAITQSTVSGRVRRLERMLGAALFRRSRAGTDLTTAGLRFEPHARALRLAWTEARKAAAQAGPAALTLRIGIQHDLLENHVPDWIAALRRVLPDSALYVEADYSQQMCRDITVGALDLAIVFTPAAHPDLHFETLGEVGYRMVSTDVDRLAAVTPDRYILPNYSPAFARSHSGLLPNLSEGTVSSGQAAVVRALLSAFGGTTYLPEEAVRALAAAGQGRAVSEAPRIAQSVFAVVHLRNRHRTAWRRMIRSLRDEMPGQV